MPPKSSPITPRGNPSTQWRSICLQPPPSSSNSHNSNNDSNIIIRHASWLHPTRPILFTIDKESEIWIADLDNNKNSTNTKTMMIRQKMIPTGPKESREVTSACTFSQNKNNNHNNNFLSSASCCNNLDLSNFIAEYLASSSGSTTTSQLDFPPLAAFATKDGKVHTVKVKSSSSSSSTENNNNILEINQAWNCNSSGDNIVSISEIQLSPSSVTNDEFCQNQSPSSSSSSFLTVSCIAYSKEQETLFVCYLKRSSFTPNKISTVVKKVKGSSRFFFASALTSFNFFSPTSCLVARGREIDALQLVPDLKFDVENDGASIELPYLFLSENIPCFHQVGPFALQKRNRRNQQHSNNSSNSRNSTTFQFSDSSSSSSTIENEFAFLVTRGGTARILMRRTIASLMGIENDDNENDSSEPSTSYLFTSGEKALQKKMKNNKKNNSKKTSTSSKTPFLLNEEEEEDDDIATRDFANENKNILQQDETIQNERIIQEWLYAKNMSTAEATTNKRNHHQSSGDEPFSSTGLDSNKKGTSGNNQHINKLESVCTCEVPGGDGYIKTTSVSPSGSVVAFGFESGVIVVGFVAARPSPLKIKYDQFVMKNTSSSNTTNNNNKNKNTTPDFFDTLSYAKKSSSNTNTNNNNNGSSAAFFIESCPQLMFITKIMSRIPRMAPSLLVIDERRASVLCLDASGVLELLIFPSALRRPPQVSSSSASTSISSKGALLSASSGNSSLTSALPHAICSSVARLAAAQRASPLDTTTTTGTTTTTTIVPSLLPPMKCASEVIGGRTNCSSSSLGTEHNTTQQQIVQKTMSELERLKIRLFEEFANSNEESYRRLCGALLSRTTVTSSLTSAKLRSQYDATTKHFLPPRDSVDPASIEAFFIDGHFQPPTTFNPYTSIILRDDILLERISSSIMKSSSVSNSSNNNNNNRHFHSKMNAIEAARVQAFVNSAPSLEPSTRATKFRLWKQIMSQKMKRLFQIQQQQQRAQEQKQKQQQEKSSKSKNGTAVMKLKSKTKSSSSTMNSNSSLPWSPSPRRRKKRSSSSGQGKSMNRNRNSNNFDDDDRDDSDSTDDESADDDDDDMTVAVGATTSTGSIDNVAFLDYLHQLQEDLVMSRYLISDDATEKYCSRFMVAP